jgi:hypothetical protein
LADVINFDGKTFFAPLGAPFTEELISNKWIRDDFNKVFKTTSIEVAIKSVKYFEPNLQALIKKNAEKSNFRKAVSDTPSGKYSLKIPTDKKLLAFQEADVECILDWENTLLAESCGMGKSPIVVIAINTFNAADGLIVCPATAKYNWLLKEWPKWTTLKDKTIGIAEGDNWPDTDFVIINYDILERHVDSLQRVGLEKEKWDFVVFDESHKLKNPDSKRTVICLGGKTEVRDVDDDGVIKKRKVIVVDKEGNKKEKDQLIKKDLTCTPIPYVKRIFASATPMDLPKDLYSTVRACDPRGLGLDWLHYHKRYCNAHKEFVGGSYRWNINGSSNLAELGVLMRSRFMLRHDPDKVTNLPPFRSDIFLLPPIQAVNDLEVDFIQRNIDALVDLNPDVEKIKGNPQSQEDFMRIIGEALMGNIKKIGQPAYAAAFQELAELREQVGIAKIPYVADFIRDKSDDLKEPTVCFGYHRKVILGLKEIFPDSAVVMGGMSLKKREQEKDDFQEGDKSLFLGNIDSAGEAITLTRSNLIIFSEFDWRGTAIIQAMKRIHRITQVRPCTGYFLAVANSIDGMIAAKGFGKIENIKKTLLLPSERAALDAKQNS